MENLRGALAPAPGRENHYGTRKSRPLSDPDLKPPRHNQSFGFSLTNCRHIKAREEGLRASWKKASKKWRSWLWWKPGPLCMSSAHHGTAMEFGCTLVAACAQGCLVAKRQSKRFQNRFLPCRHPSNHRPLASCNLLNWSNLWSVGDLAAGGGVTSRWDRSRSECRAGCGRWGPWTRGSVMRKTGAFCCVTNEAPVNVSGWN